MATILTKRSNTAGSAPLAAQLTNSTLGAELAVNTADKRLFTKDAGGAVVELGTNPSSVTMPNGTANGVAYLNGSKVLTTGSALTFDGTNLSNAGRYIVTANSAGTTDVSYGRLSGGAWINTPTGAPGYLAMSGTAAFYWDNNNLISYIGGSEQMRLTSTGLGIGTSSPAYRLQLNSGSAVDIETGVTNSAGLSRYGTRGSGNAFIGAFTAGKALEFWSAGANNATLDASGNLGIGTSSPGSRLTVKPSATSNGTFDVLTGSTNTDSIRLSGGGTVNTWLELRGYLGVKFYSDVTNTVTVDSSGNLGFGVTPSAWAPDLVRAIQIGDTGSSLSAFTTSNTGQLWTMLANNAYWTSGDVWRYARTNGNGTAMYRQLNGQHQFLAAPSGTAGNAISFTQAMTLDAAGRLLLGTTSDFGGATLQIAKANSTGLDGNIRVSNNVDTSMMLSTVAANVSGIYSSGAIAFGTGSNTFTERARITSSGNLLVGTVNSAYASGERFSISPAAGANGVGIAIGNTNNIGIGIYNGYTATGTATAIQFQDHNSTVRGSITVTTSATAYVTSSDYRLKEDVQPMTGALAKVAALKPCTYKWKVDGSAGEGFIAHELAEVCPAAVTGEKDAVNEDGSIKPQGIDTSFLVATLAAAIQELKAELDATKARLAALEAPSN